MRKRKIIVAGAFIILSACQFYLGYKKGYKDAKAEMQAQVNLDTKTLDNHAKKIDTIRTESTGDANNRLRKNLGTN